MKSFMENQGMQDAHWESSVLWKLEKAKLQRDSEDEYICICYFFQRIRTEPYSSRCIFQEVCTTENFTVIALFEMNKTMNLQKYGTLLNIEQFELIYFIIFELTGTEAILNTCDQFMY